MASTIAAMTKKAPPSRMAPQFVVRLPDEEFKQRIADSAKANNRSMNAEIVARLQATLDGTQAPTGYFAVQTPDLIDRISRLEAMIESVLEKKSKP